MNYIDIHSHLNLSDFDIDRDEVITNMKEQGIATITVGVDFTTSEKALELAEQHENLFACIGLHPCDNHTEVFDMEKYEALAVHSKVVAIGETGLDYFRDQSEESKSKQREIFIQHIALANKVQKPLMIHARPSKGSMDAYSDTLDILESMNFGQMVNFHFFVGDVAIADRIVKNGWSMSFDGPITFSTDYDEVIKSIPILHIMAETDSPFAAPAPYRGKRCEPLYVTEIYKRIGELKEIDIEECRQLLNQNVQRVFKI
ncbi:MAG: TatD family hydrolase [bacterium]